MASKRWVVPTKPLCCGCGKYVRAIGFLCRECAPILNPKPPKKKPHSSHKGAHVFMHTWPAGTEIEDVWAAQSERTDTFETSAYYLDYVYYHQTGDLPKWKETHRKMREETHESLF